jgi:hypothetical protein
VQRQYVSGPGVRDESPTPRTSSNQGGEVRRKPFWLRWFGVILFGMFFVQTPMVFAPPDSWLNNMGWACVFTSLGLLSLAGLNVWQWFEADWDTREMAAMMAGKLAEGRAKGKVEVKMPVPQVREGISDGNREH